MCRIFFYQVGKKAVQTAKIMVIRMETLKTILEAADEQHQFVIHGQPKQSVGLYVEACEGGSK
jgi:hypothetical protein